MDELNKLLRNERLRRKLTQIEAALQIGISDQSLRAYEAGRKIGLVNQGKITMWLNNPTPKNGG